MEMENIASELEREPFVPLRLHLVSGKIMDIRFPNAVFILQNALMVLRLKEPNNHRADGYDIISLRNIERVESFGEQPQKHG